METKLQMDVKVDEAEDEVDVDVVVVNLDVHVGCDMPMSIYLQPIIVITFVSKLLRSKFPGQFSN
jgi:hypothetical protein